MKRNHIRQLLLLLPAVLLAGCWSELGEREGLDEAEAQAFTVTIEGGAATKTLLDGPRGGERPVFWWTVGTTPDSIRINGMRYNLKGFLKKESDPTKIDSTKATFTPERDAAVKDASTGNKYTAWYPATLYNNGSTPALPATQAYEDPELLSGVTYPKIAHLPMYAESPTTTLTFYNLCAVLDVRLTGTDKVTKIEVETSETGKYLAGPFSPVGNATSGWKAEMATSGSGLSQKVTLDCGSGAPLNAATEREFLIALPPGTYAKGTLTIRITYAAGTPRAFRNDGAPAAGSVLERSKIYDVGTSPTGTSLGLGFEEINWDGRLPAPLPNLEGINWDDKQNYLPGLFSVSATEKVQFSRGNLQVNFTNNGATQRSGLTREWLFSENQWDAFTRPTDEEMDLIYYYEGPASLAPALQPEGTTIPLFHFGWGTAGLSFFSLSKTRFRPNDFYGSDAIFRVSKDEWEAEGLSCGRPGSVSGPDTWNGSTSFRKFDWGIHFDEDGIGYDDKYDGDSWFTMSWSQWYYVMFSRPLAVMKRGLATIVVDPVNAVSVWGLVLVPDDWQCPAGCNFLPTIEDGEDVNTYDVGTWGLMEASGAVFLPCAGERTITQLSIHSPSRIKYLSYWTSSLNNGLTSHTVALHFYDYTLTLAKGDGYDVLFSGQDASVGRCVRLVRYAPTTP